MKKILVAIDETRGALRAVNYVGQQFSGTGDLQVTLFHVMPGVPPELWDDGYILTEEEMERRLLSTRIPQKYTQFRGGRMNLVKSRQTSLRRL